MRFPWQTKNVFCAEGKTKYPHTLISMRVIVSISGSYQ